MNTHMYGLTTGLEQSEAAGDARALWACALRAANGRHEPQHRSRHRDHDDRDPAQHHVPHSRGGGCS
eukprot:scaffold287580_cov18-Tisochrysis_lutea.AAC.1